jgi:hypothetical protein
LQLNNIIIRILYQKQQKKKEKGKKKEAVQVKEMIEGVSE